jgi:hypothetical protein
MYIVMASPYDRWIDRSTKKGLQDPTPPLLVLVAWCNVPSIALCSDYLLDPGVGTSYL